MCPHEAQHFRFRSQVLTFRRLVMVAPLAYLAHIAEEASGFVAWTRLYPWLFSERLSMFVFALTNAAYMLAMLGAVALCLRRSNVVCGLAVVTWELSNAAFHVAFTVGSGTYSPGLVTAAAIYVPLAVATFYSAAAEGLLTRSRVVESLLLGAVIANLPLRLLQYIL